MNTDRVNKIYNAYSGVYDALFKPFFHPRQKLAIEGIDFKEGDKVLDVGVGTGLSLPLYPGYCQVTGVDLCHGMLEKARKKVKKMDMSHVTLLEMDACDLRFDDNSFDYVVATHIVSVVPEPVKLINEMRRVTKPGGQLVIVNHFVSSKPWVARVENFFDPFFRKWMGWRMDLSYEDFVALTQLDVSRTAKLAKVDLWKVVYANNNNKPVC